MEATEVKELVTGEHVDAEAEARLRWLTRRDNRRRVQWFHSVKRGAPRRHTPMAQAKAATCLRRMGIDF